MFKYSFYILITQVPNQPIPRLPFIFQLTANHLINMPVLRSGRVYHNRDVRILRAPWRVTDRLPECPGGRQWPNHAIAHLSQGLKIALDYLNLPVPAAPFDATYMSNQARAKQYRLQARRWVTRCTYTPPSSPRFTLARR